MFTVMSTMQDRLFDDVRLARSYARGAKGTLRKLRLDSVQNVAFFQVGESLTVDFEFEDSMATYHCALPTGRTLWKALPRELKEYHHYG